jgi:hypothetical protein
LVDHGGFAMVNVGNDGNVADLFNGHGSLSKTSKFSKNFFCLDGQYKRQVKAGGS